MTIEDIRKQRLHNQYLNDNLLTSAEEVVGWFGCVQAQDYYGAKWAVAERTPDTTDAALDKALAAGTILRTHILRPTWHFVLPADIRWMLALTAPRIDAFSAYYYRKLELTPALFAKTNTLIESALRGGKRLTRSELTTVLDAAGVKVSDPLRSGFIVGKAELDAVICSGGMKGKHHTYALLDEIVPETKAFSKEKSLAELASRYFKSHGPATIKDYIWWSGLSSVDAHAGHEMIKSTLASEFIDEQRYWFVRTVLGNNSKAHFLPNYDEYVVAYKDRSAILDASLDTQVDSRNNLLFNNTIIIDGKIMGVWKRTVKKDMVIIATKYFKKITEVQAQAIEKAKKRYEAFIGLPVLLTD